MLTMIRGWRCRFFEECFVDGHLSDHLLGGQQINDMHSFGLLDLESGV